MTFSIISYDSIRFDLDKVVIKKTLNCDGKKTRISQNGMSNKIVQYFCRHSGQYPFENRPISSWPIFLNDCRSAEADLYQIE